jgi:DNA-binding MarR family transcriptional regulator
MTEGRARAVAALTAVIDETRLLFHRLKLTAEKLHRLGETTGGKRGVLESLARQGPQTVPQLARARPVSRQHIQMLVNPLVEDGLVELVENPRHRRSKLVQLTPAGKRMVEEIRRREKPVLGALAEELGTAELERAAATMAELRTLLASSRIQDLLERREE